MDISRDIVISFSEYYDFIIRELYTLPIFYTIRWDRKKKKLNEIFLFLDLISFKLHNYEKR